MAQLHKFIQNESCRKIVLHKQSQLRSMVTSVLGHCGTKDQSDAARSVPA